MTYLELLATDRARETGESVAIWKSRIRYQVSMARLPLGELYQKASSGWEEIFLERVKNEPGFFERWLVEDAKFRRWLKTQTKPPVVAHRRKPRSRIQHRRPYRCYREIFE